jgi:hypothetical protein
VRIGVRRLGWTLAGPRGRGYTWEYRGGPSGVHHKEEGGRGEEDGPGWMRKEGGKGGG